MVAKKYYKMRDKKILLLLFIILFLGSFLRLYNIGKESFWMDEGATAITLKKYNALQILNNVVEKGQINPEKYYVHNSELPIYYIILSGWTKIFGISEFSLRAFSTMFGILSLILIFYLARYLFNEKVALLSALLASVNLTLVWYSQEARLYSYILFLSLLSLILLLKFLRENKLKYIIGFIIVSILIVYSHFPMILFIMFEGMYTIYRVYKDYSKKNILNKNVIIAFLIIGLMYLPILERAIFNQDENIRIYGKPGINQLAEFAVQLSTWLYPSIAMRQKIYDLSLDFSLYEWALLFSVLSIALVNGIFFLRGLLKLYTYKNSRMFLTLMFFFPLLFALTLSSIHPTLTIFQIKQIIYIIPAYLIFVSIGILSTKFSKLFILAILILSILPLNAYYNNLDKQQFREVAKLLPDNELVFINKASAEAAFKYYYGERGTTIGVDDVSILKEYLNDKDSFWILFTFTKYSDPEGSIRKFLDKNYKLIEKEDLFDVELLHYNKV